MPEVWGIINLCLGLGKRLGSVLTAVRLPARVYFARKRTPILVRRRGKVTQVGVVSSRSVP